MGWSLVSNGARLLGWVRGLFLRGAIARPIAPDPSRLRPRIADADLATGPEAASDYLHRRRLDGGSASTVRKLARANRIEAGLRPVRFSTKSKRELKQERRAAARARAERGLNG